MSRNVRQFLLFILLLTAVLITCRSHVTRAESYPLRVRRRGVVEEKLPDTNGMFFGKRSSAKAVNAVKSPTPQDTPFLPSSHCRRHHTVKVFCRRNSVRKTHQLGESLGHDKRFALKNFWYRVGYKHCYWVLRQCRWQFYVVISDITVIRRLRILLG